MSVNAKGIRRLLLIVAFALATACGGNNGPTVRTDDPPESEADTSLKIDIPENASKVAQRYLEVFASDRLQLMQEMLQLSAPDSPAHSYARFQIAATQASVDQGIPPLPAELEHDGDIIRICNNAQTHLPPGVERCTSFSEFVAASDSKLLRSFEVNGQSIDDRLIRGGSTAMSGGAKFTLAVGYQSVQTETLLLVVEVVNGPKEISVFGNIATYVGADGRQLQASTAIGPIDVQPSASTSLVIGFPNAKPGGRLIIEGAVEQGSSSIEVSLPVAP